MITIPTTQELYDAILADLQSEYGDTIPVFGKIFLRALAATQAGKLKMYYLAIAFLQRNIFVDTADPESLGGTLERFGRVKLGRNPFPAVAGQYVIQVTGSIGAVIPAQTTFKSNDDTVNPGKLFILDVAYELTATTDSITVRALEAGLDSKMSVGEEMTATIPIANVDRTAEVLTESVVPLAAEEIEDYRDKAVLSYRTETQGGAVGDYREWSLDAQGVQRVYPYAKSGYTSEINLYVEATVADSVDGKGTPTAGILDEVEEVVELDPDTTKTINERGRRPLTAIINFLPITVKEVEIEIADFEDIDAETEAEIFDAIEEMVNEIRPFIAGADVLADKNDILDTNRIIAAILSIAPGSVFGTVTLTVGGSPVSTYQFLNGDIPHLDTVDFT